MNKVRAEDIKHKQLPVYLIEHFCTPDDFERNTITGNVRADLFDPERVLATFGLIELPGVEADPKAVRGLQAHLRVANHHEIREDCCVEWCEGKRKYGDFRDFRVEYGCHVEIKGYWTTITFPDGRKKRMRNDTGRLHLYKSPTK